ncbi:MAG: acetate--CoA ligase family protein [Alphaproteobacteria bacterium]
MTANPRHALAPLLTPRSVALVGASPRPGNTGATIMATLRGLGFDGPLWPVNPRYEEVAGEVCYPSLAALPQPPDLAVLAVADDRLEDNLAAAIAAGARAASIFGACVIPEDATPRLAGRLGTMARAARLPINGGNCMGYCNYEARIRVTSYPFRDREPGTMSYLSQSGSAFGAIANHNHRAGLNLAVSCGSELATTIAEYMDYALELASTRVIGLFIEAVRDPARFIAALEKAAARDVPVVVLKTGRTEAAARMAISHSGALVGNNAAFDAVCRRHGMLRVHTLDELMATMLLMNGPRRAGTGALTSIHESGGERQMVVDLAADLGVPFAAIGPATVERLGERLDYGLAPENPCDAFGTGHDFDGILRDCFAALLADPATALGLFFLDAQQGNSYSEACVKACLDAAATTDKPVALATNYSAVNHHELAERVTRLGVPVLDGTVPALKAVRNAFAWRDWRRAGLETLPAAPATVRERWRARLEAGAPFDEAEGLVLLADYGIAAPAHRVAASRDDAVAAARAIGLPVVLKTASPAIAHKSDLDGVRLGLASDAQVATAYDDLAHRLGPRVLVAAMAGDGVEMIVGYTHDAQFGPLVVVGAGGTLVDVMRDARSMLAPVGPTEARSAIESLAVRPVLDGVRGQSAVDVGALVQTVVRLSVLAAELGDLIAELDINPVRVLRQGAVALDALVVPRST